MNEMSYGYESYKQYAATVEDVQKSKDSFDENVYIILEVIIEHTREWVPHIHFTSLRLTCAHVGNIKR